MRGSARGLRPLTTTCSPGSCSVAPPLRSFCFADPALGVGETCPSPSLSPLNPKVHPSEAAVLRRPKTFPEAFLSPRPSLPAASGTFTCLSVGLGPTALRPWPAVLPLAGLCTPWEQEALFSSRACRPVQAWHQVWTQLGFAAEEPRSLG